MWFCFWFGFVLVRNMSVTFLQINGERVDSDSRLSPPLLVSGPQSPQIEVVLCPRGILTGKQVSKIEWGNCHRKTLGYHMSGSLKGNFDGRIS